MGQGIPQSYEEALKWYRSAAEKKNCGIIKESGKAMKVSVAVKGVSVRNRSVVFVIRDKKILMEKLCYGGRTFYSIPGGGIEEGETPEQTAIRELKEECGLDGVIIRKVAEVYNDIRTEYSFWVSVPEEQEAIKGYDPEEPVDDQPIKEVRWMSLKEMSEKDRVFMWRYGLLEIPEFWEEVRSWGDTISYPGDDM